MSHKSNDSFGDTNRGISLSKLAERDTTAPISDDAYDGLTGESMRDGSQPSLPANNKKRSLEKTLAEKYADVVLALDEVETEMRIRWLPEMTVRAPPLESDDMEEKHDSNDSDEIISNTSASLRRRHLRTFSLSMLSPPPSSPSILELLTSLDISNNELMELPGLGKLSSLRSLNLCRNWFNTLPDEIGVLSKLTSINASRNFLRPNCTSLRLSALKALPDLRSLDLTLNQKCGCETLRSLITTELPSLADLKITISMEIGSAPGAYVGASAAERDENLLRSQLEPWGTVNLRRRLVQDFGETPTDPLVIDRAGVMKRLLRCYEREGLVTGEHCGDGNGEGKRRVLRVDGIPVSRDVIDALLVELRAWKGDRRRGGSPNNRERPSIRAQSYMILRSPDVVSMQQQNSSRRATRTAKKLERNRNLWDLAQVAMQEVDPTFSEQCTELAVTYGFSGSPHIDKQNSGPFYGLSLGDFPEGQGGIRVECSARVVAEMNTRNRLGRVDGRYPHWVAPYDDDAERFSLIYYQTGGSFLEPGPAIFAMPKAVGRANADSIDHQV